MAKLRIIRANFLNLLTLRKLVMAIERTFSIIKPDAVAKNHIGAIYNRFESAGLKIIASKMVQLSKEQAEGFYAEHSARPFFGALVSFMTSGPSNGSSVRRRKRCSS